MRTGWRLWAAVAAPITIACLLSSCSNDPSSLRVRPCPAEARDGETSPPAELLSHVRSWATVQDLRITPIAEMENLDPEFAERSRRWSEAPFLLHSMGGEVLLGEDMPDQALAQQQVAAAIDLWLENPRGELLLGFTPYMTYGIIAEGDRAGFIGSCYEDLVNPQLEPVLEYARGNGMLDDRSARDLILSFASDPDGELAEIEEAIRLEREARPR